MEPFFDDPGIIWVIEGNNLKTLAVGGIINNKKADPCSVGFDIIKDFVSNSPIDASYENLWFRFNKPPFQYTPNGIRAVLGNDNRHAYSGWNKLKISFGI